MNDIETLLHRAQADIDSAACEEHLREIEVRYLGKKGEVTLLLKSLGQLPHEPGPIGNGTIAKRVVG